jgi:hypothetical protein
MLNLVVFGKILNEMRSELWFSISDGFSWYSISNKYFFVEEICYLLLYCSWKCLGLDPFSHIINMYQNVNFLKRWGVDWPKKSRAHFSIGSMTSWVYNDILFDLIDQPIF